MALLFFTISTNDVQAKSLDSKKIPKSEKVLYPNEFVPSQAIWNELPIGERHFYLQAIRFAVLEMEESQNDASAKSASTKYLPTGFLKLFSPLISSICNAAEGPKQLCAGWFFDPKKGESCSRDSLMSRLQPFTSKAALSGVDFSCKNGTIACNPLLFCFNQEKKKVHCVENEGDETPSCMRAHMESIGVKMKIARRATVGRNGGNNAPRGLAKNASIGTTETTWAQRNLPTAIGGLPQEEIDRRYSKAEKDCEKLQGNFRRDSWYQQFSSSLVGASRHEAWCNGTGMKKEATCQDVISQAGGLDSIKSELDVYCRKNPDKPNYKKTPGCIALNAIYNKVQIPISKGEALPTEIDATEKQPASP